MTTVIQELELKVTKNRNQSQVWLGASRLLVRAGFLPGFKYTKECGEESVTLHLQGEEGTHVVTSKSDKPFLDIKGLPEKIKQAERVKIIYLKNRIIITLHHSDELIRERESDIVNTLADGRRVKVGSIYAGAKLRKIMQDAGLVQLSNDTTCRAAIEFDAVNVGLYKENDPSMWQENINVMKKVTTALDIDRDFYAGVEGIVIDASSLEIKKHSKDKTRYASAEDGYDPTGNHFYISVDGIKKTNPAFVVIQASFKTEKNKKVMEEREEAYNIIFTVYSSVLNSLCYNLEQNVTDDADGKTITLLAISRGLTKDILEASRAAIEHHDNQSGEIIYWEPNKLEALIKQREQNIHQAILSNKALQMGSAFSGNGILDLSIHEGLEDMGINSYCKFGMEWIEEYALSNLDNNYKVWRDDSFLLIGDVRNVNVHLKKLPVTHGNAMGVPCVGASKSGLVKNAISCAEEHEVAGALFISALDINLYSNTGFIVLENVPEYQSTVSMEVVRSTLIASGYNIAETVLGGNDYGALENRYRLALLATSKGLGDTREVLLNIPATVEKQPNLAAILENVPRTSTMWSWRDYLDAKAVNDKAKGNNFDQQLLTGEAEKCGTIGEGYMKGRSTEPFIIFEDQDRYRAIHEEILNSGNIEEAVLKAITSDDDFIMYSNFALNMMAKYNRRNNLKKEQAKKSALSDLMLMQSSVAECISDVAKVISSNEELKQEFIVATEAISKATRLFTTTEHCAVKRVDEYVIEGLSATNAHGVLGNGVVKTKFQAYSRRVGAFLLQATKRAIVRLVKHSTLESQGVTEDTTEMSQDGWAYRFVRNADTSYVIITQDAAAIAA